MLKSFLKLPKKHLNKIVSIFLATYMILSPMFTIGMNSPVFAVDLIPPTVPSGLHILDENGNDLGCEGYTDNRTITIDWDDNTSDLDFDYFVYDIKDRDNVRTLTASELTGNIRDLDGYYKYRVSSVDTSGNESADSDWCGVTLDREASSAPILLSPADDLTVSGNPTQTWSDVTGTDHYIYESYSDDTLDPTSLIYTTSVGTNSRTVGGTQTISFWWQVKAIDAAGNESPWSELWKLNIDNTSPVITLDLPVQDALYNGEIDLQATCDEGCDYINFWWRAEGEAYSNVSPYRNYHYNFTDGTVFNWTLDSLDAERWGGDDSYVMDDGNYYFYAAGKDLVGNWARTAGEVMITVDNTAPIASIDSIKYSDGTQEATKFVTNYNTPVILGTASDNNSVVSVSLEVNGYIYPASLVGLDWESNITDIIPDGTYNMTVTATDIAGNITVEIQSITIDTSAPTAIYRQFDGTTEVTGTIAYVNDVGRLSFTGEYSDTNPSSGLYWDSYVIFEAQDDDSFAFSQNGKQAFCSWRSVPNLVDISGSNTFSLATPESFANCETVLPDGEYYMTHQVYDTATRKDIPSINQFRDVLGLHFVVDTVKPQATITFPDSGDTLRSFTATGTALDLDSGVDYAELRFREVDELGVNIIGVPATVCSLTLVGNDWSLDVNGSASCQVPDGYYDVKLKVVDNAGNKKWRVIRDVMIDNTKPVIGDTLLFPTFNGFINGNIFALGMEVSDNLSEINGNSCRISIDGGATWNKGYFYDEGYYYPNDVCVFVGYVPSGITYIEDEFGFDLETDLLNIEPVADRIFEDYAIVDGQVLHIKAKVKDNVGNVKRKNFGTWTADSIAPTDPTEFTSDHVVNGWSNDKDITVSWPAEDIFGGATDGVGSGVLGYAYNFANTAEIPRFLSYPDTQFVSVLTTSVTSDELADGEWWFNVRTIDNVGNWTEVESYGPFYIDTVLPTVTMSVPVTDDIFNSFTALGTATDADSGIDKVEVHFIEESSEPVSLSIVVIPTYSCEATYDSNTNGWSLDVNGESICTVDDGIYDIYAKSYDIAGNTMMSDYARDVIIDNTAPTNPSEFVTDPEVNVSSQDNTVLVDWPEVGEVGGASDNLSGVAGYSYDFTQEPTTLPNNSIDQTTDGLGDNTVVISSQLSDGYWYFHIRTVDNAGNWTSTEHVGPFVIDNTNPEITLVGETPEYIVQYGVYTDDGAIAIDSIDGVLTGEIVTVDSVNTTFVGTYSVTYNVSDSAGNSADEVVRTVYVVAPVPGVEPLDVTPEPEEEVLGVEDDNGEVLGLTCDTTQTISGIIYVDDNNDGEWNEGEEVFEGIEVSISYGDVVEVVETDENGYWEFEACPAEYEVSIDSEDLPKGYSFDGEVLSVQLKEDDATNTNFEIVKDEGADWTKILLWLLGIVVVLTMGYRFMAGKKKEEVII